MIRHPSIVNTRRLAADEFVSTIPAEAASSVSEFGHEHETPPRRRFTWPTTHEAAGEWVANATVLLLIVGAIAIAIAAVWP